jgi:hypothetical protein
MAAESGYDILYQSLETVSQYPNLPCLGSFKLRLEHSPAPIASYVARHHRHTVVAAALGSDLYIKASHDNEGCVIVWDLM